MKKLAYLIVVFVGALMIIAIFEKNVSAICLNQSDTAVGYLQEPQDQDPNDLEDPNEYDGDFAE